MKSASKTYVPRVHGVVWPEDTSEALAVVAVVAELVVAVVAVVVREAAVPSSPR